MNKGVKFRAYPNKEQQNLIDRTFGCCRLVYNKFLSFRKEAFEKGEKIGFAQTSAALTTLKKQESFAFLKDVDSKALQQSLRDLDRGYQNFFAKRSRYPHFKSKHNHHQSYHTVNQKDSIRIVDNRIRLPKIGWLKIKQSMDVGNINSVTIKKTPTGKYFVVLNVDFEPKPKANKGSNIGIDVGIKEFYTDNKGNVVDNPKFLENSVRKLSREQRRLSRKVLGSKNYNKQRIKVARIHEKVINQRDDFLHKESTMLVSENQTICIENLNIKGLLRNHNIAKSIASVSWNKFFTMLEYKAAWYGSDIIKVPRTFPSSQLCSCCGYKNPLVKDLKVRKWECPKCHASHDRDINASTNILRKGLQMQST